MRKGDEILADGAKTFRERRKLYKDNYLRIGHVMHELFPEGLFVKGPEMWNKLHLYFMTMVKATRLAVTELNHTDSAHDAMVYNAMLTGIMEEANVSSEDPVIRNLAEELFEGIYRSINKCLVNTQIERGSYLQAIELLVADGILQPDASPLASVWHLTDKGTQLGQLRGWSQ